MTDTLIRKTDPSDLAALRPFYAAAFPNEDLWPLVTALMDLGPGVLSLASGATGAPTGHALFAHCGESAAPGAAALLGPLAVAPQHQRQGIGSALLRSGLTQLTKNGTRQVFLLGNPAYYSRFGFQPEQQTLPPYPLPELWRDAWQSLTLANCHPLPPGPLSLPDPWMRPAYWAP